MSFGIYKIMFHKSAKKHLLNIKSANLLGKFEVLLEIIKKNPYKNPPPYKKLSGDLKEMYSRRINIHHRLVYEVCNSEKTIKILKIWKHYE